MRLYKHKNGHCHDKRQERSSRHSDHFQLINYVQKCTKLFIIIDECPTLTSNTKCPKSKPNCFLFPNDKVRGKVVLFFTTKGKCCSCLSNLHFMTLVVCIPKHG